MSQPPQTSENFFSLLTALAQSEDRLADPNFNPEALVADIRDKVDGIQAVLIRMETVASFLRDLAKPLTSKASALMGNHARLRAYVAETMRANSFHMVPGEAFKVQLMDSPPAIEIRECTEQDALDFPDFVTAKTFFDWDRAKIKDALLNDPKSIPADLPAKITRGCYPAFKPNVPEKLETKKRSKK